MKTWTAYTAQFNRFGPQPKDENFTKARKVLLNRFPNAISVELHANVSDQGDIADATVIVYNVGNVEHIPLPLLMVKGKEGDFKAVLDAIRIMAQPQKAFNWVHPPTESPALNLTEVSPGRSVPIIVPGKMEV